MKQITIIRSSNNRNDFDRKMHYSLLYLLCIGLFFISELKIQAQLNTFYRKHDLFEFAVNPAVTGRDYYPLLGLSYRKYWLGSSQSPYISTFGAAMRLGSFNFYNPKMMLNKTNFTSRSRMGLGALIMNEKDGPLQSIYSTINYAYFVPLNNAGSELSFGLSTRLQYNLIDEGILEPLDEGDPELFDFNEGVLIPDAAFGMYYHDPQFHFGLSLNELFQSKKPLTQAYRNKTDLFVHSGYKFFLKWLEIEPSAFLGYVDMDWWYFYERVKLYYKNYQWVALAYRSVKQGEVFSSESINVALGFRFNRYYMSYSYDLGVSELVKYFDGSHEIMFGLNLGLYETEGIRKTVR